MKLVAKISAKVIGIAPDMELVKNLAGKQVARAKDGQGLLMRVTGIASAFKTGVSTFGEWVAFMGTFEAINVQTGEIFRSGKLFLPPIAANLLQGAIAGGSNSVEFAFDVGVKGNAETAQGYEWTVNPLLEIAESDPIRLMQSKLSSAPALPAPTKAVTPTAPATPAAESPATPAAESQAANPAPADTGKKPGAKK